VNFYGKYKLSNTFGAFFLSDMIQKIVLFSRFLSLIQYSNDN